MTNKHSLQQGRRQHRPLHHRVPARDRQTHRYSSDPCRQQIDPSVIKLPDHQTSRLHLPRLPRLSPPRPRRPSNHPQRSRTSRNTRESHQRSSSRERPWILPNEWDPDTADEALLRDVPLFASKPTILRSIADKEKSSYIAVITGFWYHYMLGNPGQLIGVDFEKKEVVFFDDGETLTCLSTWPQIGRAVAGLLSLPISISKEDRHAGSEKQWSDDFRNGYAYMRSFRISQEEMFASVLRVTGTEESDWRISHQPARERFAKGKEQVNNGDRLGMARAMTVRVFFADQGEACGDFERTRGTVNELLKLPLEDLDEATKLGVERSKAPPQW